MVLYLPFSRVGNVVPGTVFDSLGLFYTSIRDYYLYCVIGFTSEIASNTCRYLTIFYVIFWVVMIVISK
jgi:succinate-acetate transporter protein